MSADRIPRELNNDGPVIRLRLLRVLPAIPAALLSALSVSVFCYMRAFGEVGQYFSGELQGLLRDSLSLRSLIPALIFLLFHAVGCALAVLRSVRTAPTAILREQE